MSRSSGARLGRTAIADRPANSNASGLSPLAVVMRGAMALFSTQPLTWAASLLTVIFLPQLLGDHDLGQYAVALNTAGMVGTLAALGVSRYLVRQVAIDASDATLEGAGGLVLVLLVGILAAIGLMIFLPLFDFPISTPGLLPVALAGVAAFNAQALVFGLLNGQGRHGRYACFNAGVAVLGPCAGLGILILGGGVTGYLATLVSTSTVVTVIAWHTSGFRLDRGAFQPGLWWRLGRRGWPFLGWDVALNIRNQIDVVLVGLVLNSHTTGWLAAAYRITNVPFFIPTLIAIPIYPALCRSADNRPVFQETLRRSVSIVLILMVPISAMMIMLAHLIPGLLHWGAEFESSVPLIVILALEKPISAMDVLLGGALFALSKERWFLRVGVLGAIFNPIMNLVFLPMFDQWLQNGAIGAAIVEVATELLMCGGAIYLLPRGLIGGTLAWLVPRLALASLCLVAVTRVLLPVWLPLAIVGGGGAYLIAAAMLKIVTRADAESLKGVIMESLAKRTPAAESPLHP
jgi:O-antigen/teichoic acid export membrane protein